MRTLKYITSGLLAAAVGLATAAPVLADEDKEEKVQLKDCPEAVQKALKEQSGNGQIVEIERETKKDGTVVYEAEIKKAGGEEIDVTVAADGKLLKVEDEDKDEDDKVGRK